LIKLSKPPLPQLAVLKTKRLVKIRGNWSSKLGLKLFPYKKNFKPKFSVYIIKPKPNSAQRATGVLTVSLEQDKYRIEQCISMNREVNKDHPSSSRYSGAAHAALNIPKNSEIGDSIIRLYQN
jgi:hypothetical protein